MHRENIQTTPRKASGPLSCIYIIGLFQFVVLYIMAVLTVYFYSGFYLRKLICSRFFWMYVSSSLLLLLFYITTVYYYKIVVAYDWPYPCLSQELTLQTCVLEECLLLLSSSGEHLLIANSCRSKTRKVDENIPCVDFFPSVFLCLSSSTETVKVQRKPQ